MASGLGRSNMTCAISNEWSHSRLLRSLTWEPCVACAQGWDKKDRMCEWDIIYTHLPNQWYQEEVPLPTQVTARPSLPSMRLMMSLLVYLSMVSSRERCPPKKDQP